MSDTVAQYKDLVSLRIGRHFCLSMMPRCLNLLGGSNRDVVNFTIPDMFWNFHLDNFWESSWQKCCNAISSQTGGSRPT